MQKTLEQSLAYSCSTKEVGVGAVKRDKSGEVDRGQTMQGPAGKVKKFLFYCD